MTSNDADHDLIEFMSSSSEMGQTFAAPPGVPPEIVQALRTAFDATVKDPEYLEMMKKAGNALNPMSGEELTKIVLKTIATPKSVIDRYAAAVTIPR
jgi:tripartite-type tricarboxylate transporter receptor subunit TctC